MPIKWAEQIVGRFGLEHVATFLHDNYWDDSNPRLVAVAAETIYKCQEPGWATLQKYRKDTKFKDFLLDKRIGFRVVPYILRFGEEKAFSDMRKDARWVDECFDKDGNLKRKDVSWYEMSPVGGDLGTVMKKWCQGRPCSAEEIGWAAFDTADMVAMAFSLGMSKVATSAAKTGGKSAAKRIGRQAEKKLLGNQMRHVEQRAVRRMVAGELVNAERRLPGTLAKGVGKQTSRRGWSVFKRMPKLFKGAVKGIGKGTKGVGKSATRTWRRLKKVPSETWEKAYRASVALMWIRFSVHTVPEKGPDFVVGVAEEAGRFLGQMCNSTMAACGEFIKSAVREALGGGALGATITGRIIQGGVALLLLLLALKMLLPTRVVVKTA